MGMFVAAVMLYCINLLGESNLQNDYSAMGLFLISVDIIMGEGFRA